MLHCDKPRPYLHKISTFFLALLYVLVAFVATTKRYKTNIPWKNIHLKVWQLDLVSSVYKTIKVFSSLVRLHDASYPRLSALRSSEGAGLCSGFCSLTALYIASPHSCIAVAADVRALKPISTVLFTGASILQRRVRRRIRARTFALSLSSHVWSVYVGEWAEEIRVASLFTTPVMRCCLWATKTHWWPRYRKRIRVEKGLINALIGVILQKN